MKTYSAKATDVTRAWYVMDASEAPLGRLATRVAKLLMGKEKRIFTKHTDCGDYVIIVNAAKLVVTGDKLTTKNYYRHSQYPGGLKSATLAETIEKQPEKAVMHAIYGMLPDNKLRPERLKRLKIYAGSEHEHEAQKPTKISIKDRS